MRSRIPMIVAVTAAAMVTIGATMSPAAAHEGRRVGTLEFEVGWATEPAFAGAPNAVFAHIADARDPHPPVTDVRGTLNVEVSFGTTKRTLTMEPLATGEPGDYVAGLVPTRPGRYTFRFTGTVRGQRIDASFTSGPQTFEDVQNTTDAQFPVKDPSTGELTTRLERETSRLAAEVRLARQAARDASGQVKLLASIATGLGVVALIIGLVGIRKRA